MKPKELALRDFLVSVLTIRGMRDVIQELPQGPQIAAYLSFEGPPLQVATELVDVLGRRGAVNSEFFQLLLSLLPDSANEVNALWARWEPNPETWSAPPSIATHESGRTWKNAASPVVPKRLFVSYSRRDTAFFEELQSHLTLLIRQNIIEPWNEGRISAGEAWREHIEHAITRSDIFVLLLSPEFFASAFIAEQELDLILARSKQGAAIIPVLVRPALITPDHPLFLLQRLPRNGKSLSEQPDMDEAWLEVYETIRAIAERSSFNG